MDELPVNNQPIDSATSTSKRSSTLPIILVITLLALIIVGVLGYFVYLSPKTSKQESQPTNTKKVEQVKILLDQPISGIYPDIPDENHDQSFNTNIFDGLVNYRSGKIINALAESYVTVDPTTWRFNLRKGVAFTNGTPFTARDVKFSIEQAIKNKWPIFNPLTQISSTTVVDDQTVEIKTQKPVPDLINLLVSLPIISADQYSSKAKTEAAIGTGPYKVNTFETKKEKSTDPETGASVDVVSEETITLEANPNYFGDKPKVNKVIYQYFDDKGLAHLTAADIENNFQVIDGSTTIEPATFSALLASKYNKISITQPAVRSIFINEKSGPNKYISTPTNPFSNQKVRKALFLTLDPDQIIKEATVEGRPATQLVSSFIYGYNPNISRPKVNIEEAKTLLKDAGYPNGFTTTLDLPGNRMPQGQIMADQLAKIGITVKLNPLAKGPGLQKLLKGDFSIFFSAWASDYFDATTTFTEALATGGVQNFSNYSNKAIDEKVKEINNLQDPVARQKALQEAMVIAMDDLGWIPLWEEQTHVYIQNNLTYSSSRVSITAYGIGVK